MANATARSAGNVAIWCLSAGNLQERCPVHRIALSGLIALAAVLGSTMPAAAASTPSSTPVSAALVLSGRISCGSPKSCLAVGATLRSSNTSTIVNAWNGTTWKSFSVHAPKGASFVGLSGVSCKSRAYCLLAGDYVTSPQSGAFRPFALTWNGTSLRRAPAPPLPKGVTNATLNSVSCVAVRSCVAVGTLYASTIRTLVETWNGTKWTLHTPPDPAGTMLVQTNSVSCLSLTRCVLAGVTVSAAMANTGVFIASWNGKTLKRQKVPLPAGASNPILADVSCASAARCAAVGDEINVSSPSAVVTGFAFTEVWNGAAWHVTKIARPKGITVDLLFGVSCTSARHCVATGGAGTASTGHATALS